MALGLITIVGTVGKVKIYYKIAGIDYSIVTGKGAIGIDTTATDVGYTKLSGDLVVTSLVFTLLNVPFVYYIVQWKGIKTDNYKIISVSIGNVVYTIPEINFPSASADLLTVVNGLELESLKGTDYKITVPTNSNDEFLIDYKFIFKTAGASLVEFKIKNNTNTSFIYIKGTTIAYPVSGFTPAPTCTPSI